MKRENKKSTPKAKSANPKPVKPALISPNIPKNLPALSDPKAQEDAIIQATRILQQAGLPIEEQDMLSLSESKKTKIFYRPLQSDKIDTQKAKIRLLTFLQRSLGVVTSACKLADISRATHYQWMIEDPGYKAYVEGISEMVIDFAESKLHENVRDGKETSVIFFLKTKGKKRGYIESHHILAEEAPLHITRTIVDPQDSQKSA